MVFEISYSDSAKYIASGEGVPTRRTKRWKLVLQTFSPDGIIFLLSNGLDSLKGGLHACTVHETNDSCSAVASQFSIPHSRKSGC